MFRHLACSTAQLIGLCQLSRQGTDQQPTAGFDIWSLDHIVALSPHCNLSSTLPNVVGWLHAMKYDQKNSACVGRLRRTRR